ncbi:hypothetical protein [Chondromyces crocatus]|uniref:Ubiquinone biosynthesis protein n=1 Tax=Chondromyces crocatus TaxID=52 RepID=A0A0K1E682_CHOCO|nr:hypothetical protein [Chondromyces crocatus]AKT36396.1 uncharacterized protein CMC5_005090 [Chondromyces crocatus]
MSPGAARDPSLSLREALPKYFAENHFGDDGGYGATWVTFKFGPVPIPFPNTAARVRAVRYHDMHHLITGYRADQATGEFEISAWEIGAGCRSYWAAWQLNLGGVAGGVLIAPRRTFRAFVRGRRTSSLYGRDYEALLDRTIGEVMAECGLDRPTKARASDAVLFPLVVVAGLIMGLLSILLLVLVAPVLLAVGMIRRLRTDKEARATA